MPDADKQESFISTRQAARLLGVSVRTIQLWAEGGALRAWKTAGGHRRIARQSVDALLRQQREVIEAEPAVQPLTVVVVEDDPVYLEFYRLKIASWQLPATVITAADGFEGLLQIGKSNPDIVITDLQMPGVDGFKMIRSLQESSPGLQVVVVTALDDSDIEQAGGLPKGVEVLKKPVPLERLEVILREKSAALYSD